MKIMASGPITSWEIDGETVEMVADFILRGSKITEDGDCSHEIKRHLLLGRKVMTNLVVSSSNENHSVVSDSCDPMDWSPPDSSVHGILQARILEWVAISFSRVSSRPRNWTHVSWIAGRFFTDWARREALTNLDSILKSRDITLTTKVHLVKTMVFPVVMYGCESWL